MSIAGPPSRLRVAFLTTDNRWFLNDYANPVPHFGPAPEATLMGLATRPDLEVHIVSCTRRPVAAPEQLSENTWFHSLHVPKLGWMRTAYQGCIRATRKKLRELRPDVVHGQGTESDNAICAVLSGYPNVLTIHGNMRRITRLMKRPVFSYDWLAARLEAWTIPRSQGVVCITRHAQQEVRDLARRTWVVPNAVHSSFFDVSASPDPTAPPQIVCVARVCALKNQNALIRSLEALARKQRFALIFAGQVSTLDPYGQEFLKLVEARPWCKWVGHASRSQLQSLLGRATLLVLNSLEENCPMVILEAMAAGVPVVAAGVGGVSDLVTPGETGLLCKPGEASDMPAQIEKALANPVSMREMACCAKQVALDRYHPEVIARRHVEIYREILAHSETP